MWYTATVFLWIGSGAIEMPIPLLASYRGHYTTCSCSLEPSITTRVEVEQPCQAQTTSSNRKPRKTAKRRKILRPNLLKVKKHTQGHECRLKQDMNLGKNANKTHMSMCQSRKPQKLNGLLFGVSFNQPETGTLKQTHTHTHTKKNSGKPSH